MAFFPRNFYQPSTESASFTPLFRLLEDFDTYSRQSDSPSRRSVMPTWQPKFDIRETGEAFQLHGELPGMNKENVNIEFTEPQTMVIRGRTERNYTAGTPPQEAAQVTAAESSEAAPKSPTNGHQATVQDDDEEQAQSAGSAAVTKKSEEKQVSKKPADKAKYWLSERSIGEFTRTFNFPSRVDQENVTANFTDGILNVVVPKAKKHEARRITIQ